MELLVKYIAGEATPDEAMAVEEWIQAAAENNRQFKELQQVWMDAAQLPNTYQRPNAAHDWQAVRQAVSLAPVKSLKPYRMVYYWTAACVALFIGALGWLLVKQSGNNGNDVVTLLAQSIREEQLPDKTVLTLDANSTVTYKKDFDRLTRNLTLTGEAFFKVTHNPQKPFIIDMGGVKLQVLGTSFRVHNNLPAQRVDVDVATGRVMLYNEQDTLLLKAGQSGSYDRKEKRFLLVDAMDLNNYSYATKQFSFADTPLDKVASYLEKTYKVKIKFQNPAIKACRLSAQFDQQPIEDILEVVAGTFGITYTINGQLIYINGKGCQ